MSNRILVRSVAASLCAGAVMLGACSSPAEPTRDDSGQITEANDNADVSR